MEFSVYMRAFISAQCVPAQRHPAPVPAWMLRAPALLMSPSSLMPLLPDSPLLHSSIAFLPPPLSERVHTSGLPLLCDKSHPASWVHFLKLLNGVLEMLLDNRSSLNPGQLDGTPCVAADMQALAVFLHSFLSSLFFTALELSSNFIFGVGSAFLNLFIVILLLIMVMTISLSAGTPGWISPLSLNVLGKTTLAATHLSSDSESLARSQERCKSFASRLIKRPSFSSATLSPSRAESGGKAQLCGSSESIPGGHAIPRVL